MNNKQKIIFLTGASGVGKQAKEKGIKILDTSKISVEESILKIKKLI